MKRDFEPFNRSILKVLSGEIHSFYYLPLPKEANYEFEHRERVLKSTIFRKGEKTWISPELYQTHKLHNKNAENATITIQAYSYAHDMGYFTNETFKYILDGDPIVHDFDPDKDFDFNEMEEIV